MDRPAAAIDPVSRIRSKQIGLAGPEHRLVAEENADPQAGRSASGMCSSASWRESMPNGRYCMQDISHAPASCVSRVARDPTRGLGGPRALAARRSGVGARSREGVMASSRWTRRIARASLPRPGPRGCSGPPRPVAASCATRRFLEVCRGGPRARRRSPVSASAPSGRRPTCAERLDRRECARQAKPSPPSPGAVAIQKCPLARTTTEVKLLRSAPGAWPEQGWAFAGKGPFPPGESVMEPGFCPYPDPCAT